MVSVSRAAGWLALAAVALASTGIAGCSDRSAPPGNEPSGPVAQQAIAKARRAAGFAQYAEIFPRSVSEHKCAVAAGNPGNVFRGVCSASVKTGGAGVHTVTFSQDFGENGTFTWTIRVPAHRPARLVNASGRGLVQIVP